MAFRKIHDTFWTDPDLEDYTPEQKYFYLYLMTNPRNNQIGLFELSVKQAAFHTGYNIDTVCKLLEHFEKALKIKRSNTTKEVLIIKFWYHNSNKSPKLVKHCESLLSEVKDKKLIQYIYGMHTTSQEEEEEEEEEEKSEEEDSTTPPNQFLTIRQFYNEALKDQPWLEVVAMQNGHKDIENTKRLLRLFCNQLKADGLDGKTWNDGKSHFSRWSKIKKNKALVIKEVAI